MTVTLRFVVLQAVLVAGLAAMALTGSLAPLLASDSRWFVAGVWAVTALGIAFVAARRYADARWIQDNLLPLAVIGMQVGIIAGLGVAAHSIGTGGDTAKAMGAFFAAITVALYVSVSALAGHLWLKINLWLLGAADA